ncbi:glycosyltransferase family 4 protein [Leeuwenhoekiella sp. CH_XMU1409-2]|uniref:glycosyltransferase family 4 protein n=1 Tax=Leeuwenhoekiella sp. CH_XMU1409-2 TaxID=3107768 RepID=UPI0030096BD4
MRVLWFSNTASLYDQGKHHYNGGGWIESLETLLSESDEIDLGICFFHNQDSGRRVGKDNTIYYPIKRNTFRQKPFHTIFKNWKGELENSKIYLSKFIEVVEDFKPDVIQIFGTEGVFAQIQESVSVPVVIHIQGVINPYIQAFYPPNVNKYDFLFSKIFFLKNIFGTSPPFYLKKFKRQGCREKIYYRNAKYLMGRTNWDNQLVSLLAPQAKYFHLNEVLRTDFYNFDENSLPNNPQKLTLVSTISPTVYKGIDILLRTAELLKNEVKIDFEWKVLGISEDQDILRFFEKKLKIKAKNNNLFFLGKKGKNELKSILLSSSLFVHPSYIDNSPNSVCEAQILGIPIIAFDVGGISSIITNNFSGILVPANDIYQLASKITEYKCNPDKNIKMSKEGKNQAEIRHDRKKIREGLLEIYNYILTDSILDS